jgi:histidine triad (HIT) family protein
MSEDYYCDEILTGRVPVRVVAETGNVLAFHHVFPTWKTHIVVIPKRHVRSLDEVEDAALFAEMFQLIVQIIKDQRLAESNYKVITNGGSYQHNQHLHIHLVSGKPLNPNNPARRDGLAGDDDEQHDSARQ